MTDTTRTVVVAAVVALAVCAGAALGSPATTTTTTDEQTNETASVSVSDQQFDGESVTIDAATLPDGGFAVVFDDGGERIGHSEYIEAGDHENLTVSLNRSLESKEVVVVALYRNNGTEAYNASEDAVAYETADGADVSDPAYLYFEEPTRGSNAGASTTGTETTTDETTEAAMSDDATSDETTENSTGGVPGFTPITAVVALLAAVLVGLRRD